MGEEIEIYILKKLDDAIRESKASSEFHFAARLFLPKLHKEFTELKELIEKKRTKIKLAAVAAAAAAAAARKESNAPTPPRPRLDVRDPAANVPKIPDASKPSSSAMTGSAATSHDSSIPASISAGGDKKDSKVLPAAGAEKSEAPPDAGDEKDRGSPLDADDEKLSGAPLAGGSEKESASGDKKEIGTSKNAGDKDTNAPLDASDKKETDAPSDDDAGDKKETDAPSDDDAEDQKETDAPSDDDAGDKKETDAPSDDDAGDKKETDASSDGDAGDKKETDAPSDAVDDDKKEPSINSDAVDGEKKESDAPSVDGDNASDESKASAPATASVTSSGGKKESNVGVSAKIVSQNESEISPATDTVTGDKSITPPAPAGDGEKESNAFKTTTSAKTSSPDESEISPVTDTGAPDHKSKTPSTSAGDGKKESGVPSADKSNTTNASTKSDSKTKPVSEEAKPVSEEVLLREQLYYINNVLTEWQMISKKPFSYSSDSVFSIKDLSKTLRKIKLDLKPEKTDESSHAGTPPTASIDNASLTRTTPEVVEFRWSTRVNLKTVYGFEDKILSLERLLVLRRKDTDTFKAFGIHGMAGVGKTTLCQSIFSRPKVTEYFFPRIWVCLSKQKGEDEDNRKEVVKRMLRCVGIDDKIINKVDEKQSMRGLLFALRLQLTGKRYFIVLDDAHNPDEWFRMPDTDAENDNNKIYEKFSYGLPKECGGTVIVTSRVEQVVKNMVGEEENLRCIEPLTDQETCWNIFKDTVQEGETLFPQDLERLKAEIVKRCDGLPLAAKLLGQIKHKELHDRAAIEAGNQQAAV